jgi:hypothetical protein
MKTCGGVEIQLHKTELHSKDIPELPGSAKVREFLNQLSSSSPLPPSLDEQPFLTNSVS